jgi:hypothetical protein
VDLLPRYNVSVEYTDEFNNRVGNIKNVSTQVVRHFAPQLSSSLSDGYSVYVLYFVEICSCLSGLLPDIQSSIRLGRYKVFGIFRHVVGQDLGHQFRLLSQMAKMQKQLITSAVIKKVIGSDNMTSEEFIALHNSDADDIRNISLVKMIEQFSFNASLGMLSVSGVTYVTKIASLQQNIPNSF